MHLPPFVSAVHITESEANAKKLIESVSKWILSSWFSSWFALIFHLPIHQSDEEIGEISEGQISNTGCHKVLVLAFRFLLRKIEGEPACSDQRRTEEFHHSANGRWIKKNRTSFWTYETYLLTDPRYIYDTYPRSNRKQGRGTSVRNSRSYRSRQFGRTLHRNDRLAKEILISTKKAKDLVIWLHRRPNLLIEPMTRDSETMSNCCCLLCVKNIIREKDLPRTGRTFGNAISKLGSAGKRRATLNSHEIPPWRFLLQRASHSRASCTSRQVIFPFTGHVSQAIVNAMIQLISMYVIRFPCTMFSSSRFIYFSFFFFFRVSLYYSEHLNENDETSFITVSLLGRIIRPTIPLFESILFFVNLRPLVSFFDRYAVDQDEPIIRTTRRFKEAFPILKESIRCDLFFQLFTF